MTGGRELLLLAVMPLLVRCQKPSVSMSPHLESIFTGDLFYLYCKDVSSGGTATWYFNNEALENKNRTLKIAPAASKNSGTYQCQIKDTKSDDFPVRVLEYVPTASLTIATGQPVMRKNSRVLLEIENETGLDSWFCKVTQEKRTWAVYLKQVDNSTTSFVFETSALIVSETIYWCVNKNETYRSNQVILRTTEKEVALEMDPFPVAAGETLTLSCLVWGTNDISNSVFYKNNSVYASVTGPNYKITKINESEGGHYKCEATYRYKAQTIEASHKYDSDVQEVLVHASPFRAVLSDSMQCSCPTCSGPTTYSYYKQNAKSWKMLGKDQRPVSSGTYHCRAVLDYMRTLPSNSVNYGTSITATVIGILVAIVGIGICVFLVIFCLYKQRKTKGDIYEEVPMRQTGDPKYETLNVARVKEGEYDTLQPETEGRKKTGGTYEALTKQDNKEVYHTLGENMASEGGDGGYEALKKEGIPKDEYETLKTKQAEKKTGTGSEGGDGGYEALKKEGIPKDEYETLKTKQAEGRPGALSQLEIVEEINENK